MNAQTTLNSAIAAGFDALSPRDVMLCILQGVGSTSGSGGQSGSGDPEAVVTANPGTTYLNTSNSSFWVKETGTGNTGWIGLIS